MRIEIVVAKAANKGRRDVSRGADSRDGGVVAAYSTDVRVVFVFKRSAMIRAPSTFKRLAPKLQNMAEWCCQGVLTLLPGVQAVRTSAR